MAPLSIITDIADLSSAIDKGGVVVVLVAGVVALAWVARWLLQRLLSAQDLAVTNAISERDAWRRIALSGLQTAESTVSLAEQQVGLR